MNGGLTYKDMETLKQKGKNLDAALEWIEKASGSEDAMRIGRILRKDLEPTRDEKRGNSEGER